MTNLSPPARRLLVDLLQALLNQGRFAPGRPDAQSAVVALGGSLIRWLDKHQRIVLLGGNPTDLVSCSALGFAPELVDPIEVIDQGDRETTRLHLAGFWRDRRLTLISIRKGLSTAEFTQFYNLLINHSGSGAQLRKRLLEEQARGRLCHISLLFLDDMADLDPALSWPVRISLARLPHDLNLLSRARGLQMADQVNWREQLLSTTLDLPRQTENLAEFFAHLDLVAEKTDDYDRDELAVALIEHLDDDFYGQLCLLLCSQMERLKPQEDEDADPQLRKRQAAVQWITRRLAEQLIEQNRAGPEHFHALVLHKVLLYEEIPQKMRPRVASLQVLTSFLANPQKYFNEVESSHSPEVLETRLWRILEMLPKLVEALRFDIARQVVDFSRRFGPTFELRHKPEIMAALMSVAADVLTEAPREQQAALMTVLPQMGQTGVHILIDLADHNNRSVRRSALDALIRIGQPIVPVLFATLKVKDGWHYLRNMLILLTKLQVGGPKVEKFFRQALCHPEPNVRKEALAGIARLHKGEASALVADSLEDPDAEVRKRAVACLALTGITEPQIYARLASLLSARNSSEDLAMQVVASINRLKLEPGTSPALETALLDLLGSSGFFGLGGRKSSSSATLRVVVVQALGHIGTDRSGKVLTRLSSSQDPSLANAAAAANRRLKDRNP